MDCWGCDLLRQNNLQRQSSSEQLQLWCFLRCKNVTNILMNISNKLLNKGVRLCGMFFFGLGGFWRKGSIRFSPTLWLCVCPPTCCPLTVRHLGQNWPTKQNLLTVTANRKAEMSALSTLHLNIGPINKLIIEAAVSWQVLALSTFLLKFQVDYIQNWDLSPSPGHQLQFKKRLCRQLCLLAPLENRMKSAQQNFSIRFRSGCWKVDYFFLPLAPY